MIAGKYCKWEGFDSMEDIYSCLNPKYKGSGIACEPCQSKEDDPLNGSECYENE